ncbi:hypothetical protein [Saccharolobus caldissimus]|uniref:Uncharacterized protein n=1 Tax=Saccharolobus caldissimus TaxID=1702097 RepID=A0AAQ4CNF8_9CREN|nr:hypothetical protein [Saccharolobus caldissimus]BDB97339.1 hypothetical protein SACC_03560 [Saccharolobus caldissimus]
MTLHDVIKRYLLSEETFIEINEGEISANEFLTYDEIKIGLRVIIIGKNGRKRLVDLGLLQIIAKCGDLEFVKDYLNMSKSLRDIYNKYKVYTELEYVAVKEECQKGLDEDILNVLSRLKFYILHREKSIQK